MLAPPLLLAWLAATTGAPLAGPPPQAPRALLVLRSACVARDPAYFSAAGLRSYARAFNKTLIWNNFRILNYNETCGASWRTSVLRSAVDALAMGEAVVVSGRAGPAACALRALGKPGALSLPAECAAPHALAAAVHALASRLRWRRVLLPPHPGCAHFARAIAYELATAGLFVRQEPLSRFEIERRPSVIILCSSEAEELREARLAAGAALLMLRLEPLASRAPARAPSFLSSRSKIFSSNVESLILGSIRLSRSGNSSRNLYTLTEIKKMNQYFERDNIASEVQSESSNYASNYIEKYPFASANGSRPASGPRRRRSLRGEPSKLLLSDEPLERKPSAHSSDAVYGEVLLALERHAEAERTGVETAHNTYFLYQRTFDPNRSWVPVVTLATSSVRLPDSGEEWATLVNVVDPGGDFRRWTSKAAEDSSASASRAVAAWSALAASAAVVALTAACACRRFRRRRCPRIAPILSAADFSFPADERCVGEGMESMVSWLQQLHGGATGPGALPAPPSAPSSTCSVTRLAPDTRTLYKGEPVHLKSLAADGGAMALRRRAVDVLLVLQALRHENVNPFIGCLVETRPGLALVFAACGRGSLEDVLVADDIRLDWTFRLSLLTDLVRGMRYLHASQLRAHGRLSSRNCAVDARWVLRVTDYGVQDFARAQALPLPQRTARELLWTAPELLREERGGTGGAGRAGTQAGDVFSFAIIMQEVIVRGEPYCMLPLSPEEIVEKLCRPPPLVRPSVSLGAAPPEAVRVMRQCWAEAPALRPDFARLYHLFRHMHRGRKINIVDSMFEMLEKYSNNLEELIKERTEQLDMEKKKTEQLLNRMLPRPVAERLMLGSRVEPEEFEEVSIYFSDIVGFTALAARSSPVQVVDLLNDLYTTFDAAIEQYSVYKVETIGDAYMVVGGLPTRSRDHAERIATMALHLLHLAGRFRIRHLPATPLHLRIGLHTGPCCAAVVGLTMPRYCLFGDTVNTASRMESTGAAWRVQVSAATAARLTAAGGYRLRSRGLRQIKGKGAMHTYWLLGKEGFDKPLPTPPPLESEEVLFECDGERESEPDAGSAQPRSPRPLPRARALSQAEGDRPPAESGTRTQRAAWARSGAASADNSPPRAPPAHLRYRCLPGGPRTLRRQWSLERGDTLAAAAARAEPLALVVPPPPRLLSRYRTRPAATDDSRLS